MKVNRKLTIKQLLNKLPFENKYLNEEVVKNLKNEGPEEVEMEFFQLAKYAINSEVLEEFKKRNLIPDAGALITYVLDNPKILEEKKYIGVQLEDNNYLTFDRWRGRRGVRCDRDGNGWYDGWVFGGVRKSSDPVTLGTSAVLEFLDTLELGIKNLRERLK